MRIEAAQLLRAGDVIEGRYTRTVCTVDAKADDGVWVTIYYITHRVFLAWADLQGFDLLAKGPTPE